MELRVRVGSFFRDLEGLADEELGQQLVALVRRGVPLKAAPTVAVIGRPERLDLVGLKEIADQGWSVGRFIAGLTRAETGPDVGSVRIIGLMGTVEITPKGGEGRVPMAIVFLEWPDCRWWQWKALVEPTTREILEDTETITRAVDGDPMPDGLGRWWSAGRHLRGDVRFDHWPARPTPDADAVVH
ncbi:MAG: hypothetical protein KC656_24175 [Myxococcales bacterium]|nr:hypothetical protein [Myxococcales bacterium]MCB9669306.1 hypothetical protein [Alphaproteobacteria bacterium]MCB9690428.1 hypothetical protein [Alphaproteobacteria bacterium]